MAKIVELILTDVQRGAGTKNDPIRLVCQLWSKTGDLVAEVDPMMRDRLVKEGETTYGHAGVLFEPWHIR